MGRKMVRNYTKHQTSNFRGESALKTNGLSQNGRVINYTQLMVSRQASMRGNAIKGVENLDTTLLATLDLLTICFRGSCLDPHRLTFKIDPQNICATMAFNL